MHLISASEKRKIGLGWMKAIRRIIGFRPEGKKPERSGTERNGMEEQNTRFIVTLLPTPGKSSHCVTGKMPPDSMEWAVLKRLHSSVNRPPPALV